MANDDEVQSVRGLDDWSPAPSSGREFKYFKPPPTGRLYLNLDKVGHGKTPEQAKEFERMQTWHKNKAENVIVSDLKRVEELKQSEKQVLKSQLKVLNQLSARCKGPNEQAQKVLSLFRYCGPDEFGFISKRKFVEKLAPRFQIDPVEAEKIFEIGRKENQASEEMNYLQFREAFKRLDRSTTFIPEEYRPILNRSAAPKSTAKEQVFEPKKLSDMSAEEKHEYRYKNKLQDILEQSPKKVQARFQKRIEQLNSSASTKDVYVRTKLSFPEVSEFLKEFKIDVSPDTVRQLYQTTPGEEGLTFSQLYRRTEQYFADLEGQKPIPKAMQNMELKGQFLGCRKRDTIPEEKPVSDFLAHHGTPRMVQAAEGTTKRIVSPQHRREQRRERRHRRRRQQQAQHEQCDVTTTGFEDPSLLWKARWMEKTFERKPRKICGDVARRRVEGVSEKMMAGHGEILKWDGADVGHPLGSCRSYDSFSTLETGRTDTSRLDTGRTSITSSSSYLLNTPFATDRD